MKRATVWLVAMLGLACGSEPGAAPAEAMAPVQSLQQAERWSRVDDASRFGDALEYSLAALPLAGEVERTPWVGSYWPNFIDSINFPWGGPGSESAAHKYGRAFGVPGVEAAVSRYHGVDTGRGTTCSGPSNCFNGEVCARRSGQAFGRCMPFWWGLCHAWASAAILHPEPRHPVTYNGVTFNVQDLKALLTVVHNGASSKMVSMRCQDETYAIGYDMAGRPLDLSCRDSNPGSYHLLLTNYVGLRGRAFIEDRSIDKDVWNQPIRSFKVLKMKEVNAETANAILGVGNYGYPYNGQAERLVFVMTDVGFLREAMPNTDGYLGGFVDKYTFHDRYEYILELDRQGRIIGGEWVGRSKSEHPDFVWLPTGPGTSKAAGGRISYDDVMKLVAQSY